MGSRAGHCNYANLISQSTSPVQFYVGAGFAKNALRNQGCNTSRAVFLRISPFLTRERFSTENNGYDFEIFFSLVQG